MKLFYRSRKIYLGGFLAFMVMGDLCEALPNFEKLLHRNDQFAKLHRSLLASEISALDCVQSIQEIAEEKNKAALQKLGPIIEELETLTVEPFFRQFNRDSNSDSDIYIEEIKYKGLEYSWKVSNLKPLLESLKQAREQLVASPTDDPENSKTNDPSSPVKKLLDFFALENQNTLHISPDLNRVLCRILNLKILEHKMYIQRIFYSEKKGVPLRERVLLTRSNFGQQLGLLFDFLCFPQDEIKPEALAVGKFFRSNCDLSGGLPTALEKMRIFRDIQNETQNHEEINNANIIINFLKEVAVQVDEKFSAMSITRKDF